MTTLKNLPHDAALRLLHVSTVVLLSLLDDLFAFSAGLLVVVPASGLFLSLSAKQTVKPWQHHCIRMPCMGICSLDPAGAAAEFH